MVIALVLMLVGMATFAVGVLETSQAWVFASIGSTAAAGVVLFTVHRQGRRAVSTAGAETSVRPTSPAPMVRPPRPPPPSPAGPAAPVPSVEPTPDAAGPHPREGIEGRRDDDLSSVGGAPDQAETFADRLFVPPPPASALLGITGYDELRVAELLPLLPALPVDQLALVRAHEGATKRRATVLARLDQLLAAAPGTPADPADAEDDVLVARARGDGPPGRAPGGVGEPEDG